MESPASAKGPWSPPAIDPANFVSRVDNPYLPLAPGTTLRYRGAMKDGTTPQVDTFAVTHQRKIVMGVACTVVRDTVTSRGRPVERTYDWFAQDRQGNVWYMGEETQELKHGHFGKMIDSGPAGRNGAQPGLMMEAHPMRGDSYWQFHWPGHAMDTTIVLGSGGQLRLPYRDFEHTLLTQEQSPLEPGVRDRKWSVRGIGYVQERAANGSHEQIKLVSVTQGGQHELEESFDPNEKNLGPGRGLCAYWRRIRSRCDIPRQSAGARLDRVRRRARMAGDAQPERFRRPGRQPLVSSPARERIPLHRLEGPDDDR